MYTEFKNIANQLYNKAKSKNSNGKDFIDDMYNSIVSFKFNTIAENDANISYSLATCLEDIDANLARQLKAQLDKSNKQSMMQGNIEGLCQYFFKCSSRRLDNVLIMLDKYSKTIKDIEKSVFPIEIYKFADMLKDVIYSDKKQDIINCAKKLENSDYNLSVFCDNIESELKTIFLKGLNKTIKTTADEIKSNSSKVKVFDGQKFNFLIHSSNNPDMLLQNLNNAQGFSVSLIDDKNIMCYGPMNTKFAFYSKINDENLGIAHSNDASTSFDEKTGTWSSFAVPNYIPIDEFKKKTRDDSSFGYSEIGLNLPLKPNAIICYDNATVEEVELAKKNNLDIILIKTKNYPNMKIPESLNNPIYLKHRHIANLSNFEFDLNIEL